MADINPLLSEKIPGKVFTLPSRGIFYTNGELDDSVEGGELHIRPLSGFTELSLKNPDLLFNGKAIIDVFAECVPEVKKPLELAAKDVDALLFYIRMVTYGSEFVVEVTHDCEDAKSHSYIVSLDAVLNDAKFLDPTIDNFSEPVEVAGKRVYVRPSRFKDVVTLFHQTGSKKEFSDDDLKKIAKMNLMSVIARVDDVTKSEHIEGWLSTLTSKQLAMIAEAAGSANEWGINPVITMICKDCKSEMKVELPLNPINFFTG